MQELIQMLMQQAHLSMGQAQQALGVALNFIRSRVPALAPYLGALGGATTTTTTSGSAPAQSGGLIGDIEHMFGGGSGATSPAPQSSGGAAGGIEGALGNLFSGGGSLHQELVQNAGLTQSQAASSVNVIQSFISQHVPAAAGLFKEGSALDNVEDRVDSMFGIKDNNPGT